MNPPSPDSARRAAPVTLSTLLAVAGATVALVGTFVGMGIWKGSVDEKFAGLSDKVAATNLRVDRIEPRLSLVESQAQAAVLNTQIIINSLAEFKGDTRARFDRQMQRLDQISAEGHPQHPATP